MSIRISVVLLVVLVTVAPGWTQEARSQEVQFIPRQQLDEAVAPTSAPLIAEVVSDLGHYKYIVVRREESGVPEVHEAWADVTVVREGGGTLIYGGRVTDGEETGPGEIRGGRIVGGQERRLAVGDVVVIPPTIPHQIRLEDGESIVYTVVKVEQPPGGATD